MSPFNIATSDQIKQGKTTDIYFVRTKQILEAEGRDRSRVVAEVTTNGIPGGYSWGVLCGTDEVASLFEGVPVNVQAMQEGSIFHPYDERGFRTPILTVEGSYAEFCELETPMLGFLCQSSGVATRAARIKLAAGNRTTVAFGVRRMHPALAPALDRAAYIGGMDGVSSLIGAEVIGQKPSGTMPHSLMIVLGDQIRAWKAFDEIMPPDVPRICLVDTYFDEKVEALMAADAIGDRLQAVRLDTPGSRRGDLAEIIREVRWELDLKGYDHVKIFVSGGLDEETVKLYGDAGADAFGVGTWVSGAPTIDFAFDIVDVEGRPAAKRGKLGGRKQVWRCPQCLADLVKPYDQPAPECPSCGGDTEPMLRSLIEDGRIVADQPTAETIRSHVLEQLQRLNE